MYDLKDFQSEDARIAFLDEGAGEPVLLIHGFGCNTEINWIEPGWVDALLEAGHRVIAPDCRGHGASEKLYGLSDYSTPIMAEDVRRLLDHLDIEAANIFGYSMGARIAAFVGVAHPDRVSRIVFGGLGINMLRRMIANGPIARSLEVRRADEVLNTAVRSFREFAEECGSDLRALAACLRSTRETITQDMLQSITMPAFVVCGSEDVFSGSPEKLAEILPRARALEIPDATHQEALRRPIYKQAVLGFLRDSHEMQGAAGDPIEPLPAARL